MATENSIHEERCDRCGEMGEDRRTLHMSCMYAMEELGLPFQQYRLKGDSYGYKGKRKVEGFVHLTTPEWTEEPTGQQDVYYYTLRVCKDCRADWMGAIANWFNEKPVRGESPGTGIYIRERGGLKEITLEEWEARKRAAGK